MDRSVAFMTRQPSDKDTLSYQLCIYAQLKQKKLPFIIRRPLPNGGNEYWKLSELESVKATLPVGKWNAQWMQNPTSEEGSLIKREWWRKWDRDYIPQLEHIIQSYDTAFLKKESADYSAITTWGVFHENPDGPPNLILLDALKERLEFPELRKKAKEQYDYWKP